MLPLYHGAPLGREAEPWFHVPAPSVMLPEAEVQFRFAWPNAVGTDTKARHSMVSAMHDEKAVRGALVDFDAKGIIL